jgi:hypothetical protein
MINMTGSKLSIFSHLGKITGYWITTRSLVTSLDSTNMACIQSLGVSQIYMYLITWRLSQNRRYSITWCLMQKYSM